MAVVDEMFAEEPMVEIDLDVIAVEHAEGHNWGLVKWKGNILCAKEGGETLKLKIRHFEYHLLAENHCRAPAISPLQKLKLKIPLSVGSISNYTKNCLGHPSKNK